MTACAVRRNGLSRSPTVGCGVFAVRAKISPPVATMRRSGFSSDVACRVAVIIMPHRDAKQATPPMWEQQRIPFLSIVEICCYVLGRGGAERSECPPWWGLWRL